MKCTWRKKKLQTTEKAELLNRFFQIVFHTKADGRKISGSKNGADHWFHAKNTCIGSIGSEQEDSFHKLVAGHPFQASGNENTDFAQDGVPGYRFCSNRLSKID